MDRNDPKVVLSHYLSSARDALRWKLDGLSDYDVRRPVTPTGTNLLGIVKHLACVELGYFGDAFDRPHGEPFPGDEDEPNADMYATADETRGDIMSLYDRAAAHSDAVIAEFPLGHRGRVPWWPAGEDEVTVHLGHADIVREQLDGAIGHREDVDNLPDVDAEFWPSYVERVEAAARAATAD